jgi:hypothetical protein
LHAHADIIHVHRKYFMFQKRLMNITLDIGLEVTDLKIFLFVFSCVYQLLLIIKTTIIIYNEEKTIISCILMLFQMKILLFFYHPSEMRYRDIFRWVASIIWERSYFLFFVK